MIVARCRALTYVMFAKEEQVNNRLTGADMTKRKLEGVRVLVVEDEYMIADDLVRVLSEAGAKVIGPASSLTGATDLAEATLLDAAVLDINLRGIAVYPLVDMLRARGVPVVLATGYGTDAIPLAYADLPHCEKPVTPETVRDVVAQASVLPTGPLPPR